MKKLFVVIISLSLIQLKSLAQGCVAVRSGGAVCTRQEPGHENKGGWQLNLNYRYFHSFRHFVGTQEQKERVEKETDVRNWSRTMNITLFRQLNNRWSLGLDLPVISNTRSSLYEHYGNTSTSPNARRSTHSFGLGDIRISANYWVFDPLKAHQGNVQVGLGLKLATGDYNFQDYFWKNDTTRQMGPVDQSIQLGDGGTGISVEVNAYYNFNPFWGVYSNLYYLSNPREQNGVSTARGGTPTALAIKYTTSVMSVPDQYLVRAGANYGFKRFNASAGFRIEGIPSDDLIGGNAGFRRPGYAISAEPGFSYMTKKMSLFATVPIALVRNRTQSYSDKLRTQAEGVKVQGDAAFADYLINIGMSWHL